MGAKQGISAASGEESQDVVSFVVSLIAPNQVYFQHLLSLSTSFSPMTIKSWKGSLDATRGRAT